MTQRSNVQLHTARHHPGIPSVLAVLTTWEDPVLLDSASAGSGRGRYTLAACRPLRVRAWGGPEESGDPFVEMRQELHRHAAGASPTLPPGTINDRLPFAGGWIGYFGYDTGRYVEKLPFRANRDIALPVARFALYDAAAIYDHHEATWWIITLDLDESRESVSQRVNFWNELLGQAGSLAHEAPVTGRAGMPVEHNLPYDAYIAMVERARRYIADGDIFQVNLARRESYPLREPAWQTYLRLRDVNAAEYAAFLQWSRKAGSGPSESTCAVLSSSPELFLDVRGRRVITRPIKGTRPRSADPVVDRAYRSELTSSGKDRAELAMIVDLLRNDLGRVCEYGSIRVLDPGASSEAHPFTLETHPTVHHLVSTIVGRLAPGHDVLDLLRACFPGGSITGAPKVRAMEIIDELEPTGRSVYTGSIGYLSLDGQACFNIAIRTLIACDGRIHLHTGGGIVADSDPAAEYEETEAKALGMQQALGAAPEVSHRASMTEGKNS